MSEVGIVIVTFNSEGPIGACLDAALTSGADVVVVDNGSSDSTVAQVRRRGARLIANPSNRGFAAAVNQGFAVLNSTYVLLLNPDAVLQSSLAPLREACERPRTAGAGGQLLGPEGCPQIGFMVRQLPTPAALILEALLLNRLWKNNPVNRQYRGLGLDYSVGFVAEQPAGAFLMVRRQVWQELDGFDEGFFPLWFEDVDFCRRAVDRGYSLHYEPQAVAKHTGGHSIPKMPVEMQRLYWYRNLLRYSAKHFRPPALRVVSLAVVAGSLLRSVGELVLRRSPKSMAAYGRVIWLASRCLLFGWSGAAAVPGPSA